MPTLRQTSLPASGRREAPCTPCRPTLADPGAARRLFDQAENQLGPLDILVNNAGVVAGDPIADTTDEVFDAVLAVNLKSPFALIREAARRLREGGRVVNISTLNTVLVGPRMAPYASSKAALDCLAAPITRRRAGNR